MCPSDANGVYSLPSGSEAVTGEVIQATTHNTPVQDLASSMSARLMRTGVAPMTGPLKITDGSVGSPGLKFNSDGTTGFYKTASGIGVSVGGTKVAEFTANGVSRMLGELIPWTLLSAPSGWVLPYGQTLSRATYADLWTIAQTEIAAGNAFYNNGDGSTTFGIGDLRGRVVAGKDNMGGTAANRLTSSGTGFATTTLGAAGGTETVTLTISQLPTITPAFNGITDTVSVTSTTSNVGFGLVASFLAGGSNPINYVNANAQLFATGSFTPRGTIPPFGGGVAHGNVQPTMICNFILFAGA